MLKHHRWSKRNFRGWCRHLEPPARDEDTDKGWDNAWKKWLEREKKRTENKRRWIKIKERQEREKEREGKEEMWAKSVFLSWPVAAKAWPGSTMTHSLIPPRFVPPLARLVLAKRPPTPNCRRQSLFQMLAPFRFHDFKSRPLQYMNSILNEKNALWEIII